MKTYSAAYIGIGVIYKELTKPEETLKAFEKSITYDSDNIMGLANTSWLTGSLPIVDLLSMTFPATLLRGFVDFLCRAIS